MFTRLCRGLFSLYFHNKITQFSLKKRSFFNKRKEEQIFVLSYNQCIFEGYSVFKSNNMISILKYYPAFNFVLEGGKRLESKIKKGIA